MKIAVIGGEKTGKTTWINRLMTGDFTWDYIPSKSVTIYDCEYEARGTHELFNYQLYDIPSHMKSQSLYEEMDGCIVFFDLTVGYRDVIHRIREFQMSNPYAPLVVAGSKCDVFPRRRLPHTKSNIHWMKDYTYIDISAKSCHNFDSPFIELKKKISL